jgi:hypothetical protein
MEYDYKAFLLFLSQMVGQRKAKIVLQGNVIFVETESKNERWSLSTKILDLTLGSGAKKSKNLLSRGFLKWQEKGAYLKVDPETQSLCLIQHIASSKKYLPFKAVVQDFALLAVEWKEIFAEQVEYSSFIHHVG